MHPAQGLHIEQPYVPHHDDAFERARTARTFGSFQATDARELEYVDTYWDTDTGDLHGAALSLRFRNRSGYPGGFLDFKDSPRYLAPGVFARPLVSEKLRTPEEAESAVSGDTESLTMSVLFDARPDLVGRAMRAVAKARVRRRNVDLLDSEQRGVCTLSFHDYAIEAQGSEIDHGQLVEVQPIRERREPSVFRRADAVDHLIRTFASMQDIMTFLGFVPSPSGKYHRIPRHVFDKHCRSESRSSPS
jgi:hypothetical protein